MSCVVTFEEAEGIWTKQPRVVSTLNVNHVHNVVSMVKCIRPNQSPLWERSVYAHLPFEVSKRDVVNRRESSSSTVQLN